MISWFSDTIQRHQALYEGKSSTPKDARMWVYCNEDSFHWKACTRDNTGVVVAYEASRPEESNWFITFCPVFFERKWRIPLEDKLKAVREGQGNKQAMETYDAWPGTHAATFFHESMSVATRSPGIREVEVKLISAAPTDTSINW